MRSHTTLVCLSLGVMILLFTTGCAHNNAMFFGTNTVVGLDARADAGAGGTPTVAIGYRRQEAVWMPLLANQEKNGKIVPGLCAGTNSDCHFEGTDNKDTYSVLASFGTNAGASASTGAEANLQIAQYFATGLAARYLAARGGEKLVAIQPSDSNVDQRKVIEIMKERESHKQKVLNFVNDGTGKVDKGKLENVLKGTALENEKELLATAGQPLAHLSKLLTDYYFYHVDELAVKVP